MFLILVYTKIFVSFLILMVVYLAIFSNCNKSLLPGLISGLEIITPAIINNFIGVSTSLLCNLGYEVKDGEYPIILSCKENSTWFLNTTRCTRMPEQIIFDYSYTIWKSFKFAPHSIINNGFYCLEF